MNDKKSLRIGLITDIHHGPDRGTKMGSAALGLVREFAVWANDAKHDLVVEMGDRISDVDHATDLLQAAEIAQALQQIKSPRVHLLGNHDVHELSIVENEKIYGFSFASRSMDLNGFHLIFWNPDVRLDHKDGFTFNQDALTWLENDLKTAAYPTVLFSHVPLSGGSMVGNFYFENVFAHHTSFPASDLAAIRDVIEQSGKVILCVNGHTHWNAVSTIDGVHYITIPSLTETFTTHPHPNAAWAELRLDSKNIEVEVYGRTPTFYRLPVKAPDHHWANVDKSYAPASRKPA